MNIPGLPEGVECVRFGVPGPDEFEITSDGITKKRRLDTGTQVIVRPADGWEFIAAPDGSVFAPVKNLPGFVEMERA